MEEQGGFDIVLLDVYMAGMLGTDAARELRQLDDAGEIIFIAYVTMLLMLLKWMQPSI